MNSAQLDRWLFAAARLASAVFAALLAFAGCAPVAPQQVAFAGIDLPAQWSGATLASDAGSGTVNGSAMLAQWWLHFDDPLLGSLVADALQANGTVNGARAALWQARAVRDVAAASLSPSVAASLSAQRSMGDSSTGNSFKAGLDASWELDVFGANRAALRAAGALESASAASLADIQVSVAAEVALNYIALRSTQARLALARSSLANQQETLQIARWRQQAGLATSLEAEQSLASVEQTRAQLPVLQTTLTQTAHAIAVLTGRQPTALSTVLDRASAVPQAAGDIAISFPAETLRQRPDLRAAEFQVQAAAARVAQADAGRLPSFKLGGSLGLNALTLGTLTSSASLASGLMAGVSLPLFDGGAASAQLRAQQAALEQARIGYQSTVLTALKDVEDALVALRGDRERLSSLQIAAEAASNAALLASQRYNSGLVDFQTVLETQRTQLGTQDSVAGAMAAVSADHVRLYKALGGGWRPDSDTETSDPPQEIVRTPPS